MSRHPVQPSTGAVVQRDADGVGWIDLSAHGRPARIRDAGGYVRRAEDADSVGLPTGGPYSIEVPDRQGSYRTAVESLYVGDLWVLAGQSNMAGSASTGRVALRRHPAVRVCRFGEGWAVATERLVEQADDPEGYLAHIDPEGAEFSARQRTEILAGWHPRGFSLGAAFGLDVYAATGVPVGLLPTAVGGSLLDDWRPPGGSEDAVPHYLMTLELVVQAGGSVCGVLWYQGESDANQRNGIGYAAATTGLIGAFRRDLPTGGRPLRVYLVQQCRMATRVPPDTDRAWSAVREAQRDLTGLGADGMVSAVDLQLDDIVHIDAEGLVRLGARLARLATGSPTLNLAAVRVAATGMQVDITYVGVTGRLAPQRNLAGFSIRDGDDNPVPIPCPESSTQRQRANSWSQCRL